MSLLRAVIACATIAAVPGPASYAQSAPPMRGEQLQPNLIIISGYANGNMLAFVSDGELLLVDAQSGARASLADSVLHAFGMTQRPALVINTHYHDDHVGGNAYWRERGAALIAHAAVPAEARKDTLIETRKWQRRPQAQAAVPFVLIRDSAAVEWNGELVHVIHMPAAHTGGDLVVWLPSSNVLHMGDIVEIGAPPFVDWWAGGSLEGMIAAVDWALARVDQSTRIVPGHGPVIHLDGLRAYREMLVAAQLWCSGRAVAEVAAARKGDPSFACRPG